MSIPDDWQPNEEHKALVAKYGLDLDAEVASFRGFKHRAPIQFPNGAFAGFLRKHGEQASHRRVLQFPGGESQAGARTTAPTAPTDPVEATRQANERFRESNPRDYDRLLKYLEGHRWWTNIPERVQLDEMRQAIRDRHMIFEHMKTLMGRQK